MTSPLSQPDLFGRSDGSPRGVHTPGKGQELAAGGENPPVETPNYPEWWLEAIRASNAVCDALRACQTPSEVDACAKEHRETYERLSNDPRTAIFGIHIRNLALVRRGPAKPKIFPGLRDAALEAAVRAWPIMKSAMLQSEDDKERMFYFSYAKKLEDPNWEPSPRQAAHMKRIHMGWQVIETGVIE